MLFSINEKVVSNLRLAGSSLQVLRLPPPPKTDILYPLPTLFSPFIASLLYKQILSVHVKSPQRRSTTALEAGAKMAVHAKIHSLVGACRSKIACE